MRTLTLELNPELLERLQTERRRALKNRKLDPPLSQTIIEMREQQA